jgi:AcrR family transcriptional regulator
VRVGAPRALLPWLYSKYIHRTDELTTTRKCIELTAQPTPEARVRKAAHRPSRRDEIIAAAVDVFAELGFAEASVNEIADAANVVVSGIYYHFDGKAELFDAAIAAVYESLDAAIETARVGHAPGSTDELASVIRAGGQWVDDHPHAAKMLYSQLPGATPESARLRHEHEAGHVAMAHRYVKRAAESGSEIEIGSPAGELAARTLVHLMISVMPLRLEGGLLSRRSPKSLEASLQVVGNQIVFG